MFIQRWTGPPVETHTYLMLSPDAGRAWVVDAPLDTYHFLREVGRERGVVIERLILTHAHFDHLLDAGKYREAGVPLMLHPLDLPLLHLPQTRFFGLPQEMPDVEIDLPAAEGQELTLGDSTWQVWHTPGHAPGHIALYSPGESMLVGGDLLFQGGYGRLDLPFCDREAMRSSLGRLLALPDETQVLPGHGPRTTIGRERAWLEELVREGRL